MDWRDIFSIQAGFGHVVWGIILAVGMRALAWAWGKSFGKRQETAFWLAAITICTLLLWIIGQMATSTQPAPDLKPRMIFFDVGRTKDGKELMVLWQLGIHDSGAASVILDWELTVRAVNKQIFNSKPLRFPLPITLTLNADNNSTNAMRIALTKENYFSESTRDEPIPQGGHRDGYIAFMLHDVAAEFLQTPGTSYEVSFRDTRDKRYSVNMLMTANMGRL